MCLGCYARYGFPKIITPTTLRGAELAAGVYEHSLVGGNLHIVLDDWNLEDDNLKFCDEQIAKGGYEGRDSPAELAAERECCDAFKAMSEDERASSLALYDKFLLPDGSLHAEIDEAAMLAELEAEDRQ